MTNNLRSFADIDRVIHEPARTMIVAALYNLESADFLYLQRETGLTQGNLSTHLIRLEDAGYVRIEKTFRGKVPRTLCSLTESGRQAFDTYRQKLKEFLDHEA